MTKTNHSGVLRDHHTFAIVPTHGRYASHEYVDAERISRNGTKLRALARKWSREFQATMEKHGGSSAGYRVVQVCVGESCWRGNVLDKKPTV